MPAVTVERYICWRHGFVLTADGMAKVRIAIPVYETEGEVIGTDFGEFY